MTDWRRTQRPYTGYIGGVISPGVPANSLCTPLWWHSLVLIFITARRSRRVSPGNTIESRVRKRCNQCAPDSRMCATMYLPTHSLPTILDIFSRHLISHPPSRVVALFYTAIKNRLEIDPRTLLPLLLNSAVGRSSHSLSPPRVDQ